MKLKRIREDYLDLKKDIKNGTQTRKSNSVYYSDAVYVKKHTF
jgi:hypothetical protein